MSEPFDVIVVGGGMVGASLACALAMPDSGAMPLRVGLMDAREPAGPPQAGFDARVSAITRASARFLDALGVWDGITARGVGHFREMHVWDAGGSGEIHFDSADVGEHTLGYIVENGAIVAGLWERLRSLETVELLCPQSPVDLHRADGVTDLVAASGDRWRTGLLVGADGFDSPVRALAGIDTQGWMYDQMAVVTTVRPERHHADIAWQRFLPNGPLAFLPLPRSCCSIVWSTTPEEAGDLLAMHEDAFAWALSEAFEHRLDGLSLVGPRHAFPLRLQHARSYVRPGIALVGDAAHTVHPLAGQGVNLGFLDAAVLAEVLSEEWALHKRPGRLAALRRYERRRKGDNLAMMAAVDGLKRLFGSEDAPLRFVRNLGLKLTDSSGPVKQLIMRRAMGFDGDLPRIVRGRC